MKIIDHYISLTLCRMVGISLVVLLALFAFLSLVDQLEETGRGNYGVLEAIQYVLLTLPRLAYELFPIAAIIGSMTTLGILSRNSELAVLRTSGISNPRLAWSLCKGGILIILLATLIGELVAPYCEQKAQHLRSVALTEQITLKTEYGFWSRDGQSFINIRTILPGDQVEDIYIYEFDEKNRLRSSTYAKYASFVDGQWLLKDIDQTMINEEQVTTQHLKRAAWESLLDPDVLNLVTIKPQYLTLWELFDYIAYLVRNGQNSQQYEQALWSKLIYPFSIIVMILLAIPLVRSYARVAAIGQRIFIGCLIGIVFHIFNQVAGQLGIVFSLSPAVSATAPTILVGALTLVFLYRQA